MSTKLKANTNSELTRLKAVWRDLADDARHYWLSRFVSPEVSQAEVRKEISVKLKINLRWDSQLTNFRNWVMEQQARDAEAERQSEDETQIAAQFPGMSAEQLREQVLLRSYARHIADGDFAQARQTMKQDLAERSAKFQGELELAKLALAKEAEARMRAAEQRMQDEFELKAAGMMLDQALRAKADEINASNLSNADKIAAMRQAAFADVEKLEQSGRLTIPK